MVERLRDPPERLIQPPPDPWFWFPRVPRVRVYHEHPLWNGREVRTFGPLNRLDPHVRDGRQRARQAGDGRGVLYVADALRTGLAEAYSGQRPQVEVCPYARAVWLVTSIPLPLLDITGDDAMAVGALATLGSGDEPRRRTQRWGRRIYEQYEDLVGIKYSGAHQGGTCFALWERVRSLREVANSDRRLVDQWAVVQAALAASRRVPVQIGAARCPACRDAGFLA